MKTLVVLMALTGAAHAADNCEALRSSADAEFQSRVEGAANMAASQMLIFEMGPKGRDEGAAQKAASGASDAMSNLILDAYLTRLERTEILDNFCR